MNVFKAKTALSAQFDFTVALTTIYWSTFARLEGYFGIFATLGAYSREHLSLRPVAIAVTPVAFCPS